MNSTSADDFTPLPSPTKHRHPHGVTRAKTFLVKANRLTDSDQEKFTSQSQTNLPFAEETVDQFHLPHRHSSRVRRWVQQQQEQSNFSSPTFVANSLIDFKDEKFEPPNLSIRQLTSEDFNQRYQQSMEQLPSDHIITAVPIPVVSSDDEVDENDNQPLVLDPNQPITEQVDSKPPKKKSKSEHSKKNKSNLKRHKTVAPLSQPSPPINGTSNANLDTTGLSASSPQKPPPSAPPTKTEEIVNGCKPLITVDTSRARSNIEVVRACLRELGWKECTNGSSNDTDIFWHSTSFHENNVNFSSSSGRVNKFPCMSDLLRKIHLTRSLNHMRVLFPQEYNFYPQTWFLPEQSQQFKDDVRYIHQQDKKHHRSLTTFIVKPSDGSQGEGIYLLRDPTHIINTNRPHVIQEYIDRPLLIDGLKFDLRIYVLILNLYPLEIFLYDEGLVRFATVDYKAPSTENLHETYMHLTNYSLNKRSANYKHATNDQQTDGSKRKLSLVWQQLSEAYGVPKIDRTKSLIVELINKTIIAIVPELRVEHEHELPVAKRFTLSCFQIVGFDIIIDDQLKPILLEVNSNPSLRIDFDHQNELGKIIYTPSPIDEEIKKPLILETLKLALPRKKLETIARHLQLQANDEIMAQRLEKVAQRRVEERNEKLKSARASRFDVKLNPFFSRPLDGVAKEVERQQKEQQKSRAHSPSRPTILLRFNEATSPIFQAQRSPSILAQTKSMTKSATKTKKAHLIMEKDEHENGMTKKSTDENQRHLHRSGSPRRSAKKSAALRHSAISTTNSSVTTSLSMTTTTDLTMIHSIKSLKLIFPSQQRNQYQRLFLIDQIASFYIHLVVFLGQKTMTGRQFRNFATICGIINETITAPSIDILYYQMLRKWQQFVLRTTATGLPFSAFIEAFFLLSQRKFPSASSLLESVDHLVQHCNHYFSVLTSLNTSISSLYQSNPLFLQRPARTATVANSASLNIRPNLSPIRSPTSLSVQRPLIVPPPPPAPLQRSRLLPQNQSVSTTADGKGKQSTKSVFPLFFDVI